MSLSIQQKKLQAFEELLSLYKKASNIVEKRKTEIDFNNYNSNNINQPHKNLFYIQKLSLDTINSKVTSKLSSILLDYYLLLNKLVEQENIIKGLNDNLNCTRQFNQKNFELYNKLSKENNNLKQQLQKYQSENNDLKQQLENKKDLIPKNLETKSFKFTIDVEINIENLQDHSLSTN